MYLVKNPCQRRLVHQVNACCRLYRQAIWSVREKPSVATASKAQLHHSQFDTFCPLTTHNDFSMAPKPRKGGSGGGKSGAAEEEREEPLQALVRLYWTFPLLESCCSPLSRYWQIRTRHALSRSQSSVQGYADKCQVFMLPADFDSVYFPLPTRL